MTLDEQLAKLIEDVVRRVVREELGRGAGEEFLSTKRAAKVADVATETIRDWVKTGKLARHRVNGRLRIERGELVRYLKSEAAATAVVRALPPEQLARRSFGKPRAA